MKKHFGDRKPTRGELIKKDNPVYAWLFNNNLIDKYCTEKILFFWDEEKAKSKLYELFGNKKPRRIELEKKHLGLYTWLRTQKLLDKYCTPNENVLTEEIVKQRIKEEFGDRKPLTAELHNMKKSTYPWLRKNNLVEKYSILSVNVLNEEIVKKRMKERYGNKKPLRSKLYRDEQGTYNWLYKKNMLDKYCLPKRYKS